MSILQKFTIESVTIVAALIILVLVLGGVLVDRAAMPKVEKPVALENGSEIIKK
jgi:hypothetical protein